MALTSTVIYEVQTGGSDTLNGGCFDPAQTMLADLTATGATSTTPVVTSASYAFTANDKFIFVKSGTNWQPGYYPILSFSGNTATLDAAIGKVMLYDTTTLQPNAANTVAGCSSNGTATISTVGTWTIDYSQNAACVGLTNLSTASVTATTVILGAGFTKAMIGSGFSIPSGVTNATSGIYMITAVTAGVSATLDRTWNTNIVAVGWTGGVGGAFASIGKVGSIQIIAGQSVFQKYSVTPYGITSTTANISGGVYSIAISVGIFSGYNTTRHFSNTDLLMPTNQAQGISTCVLMTLSPYVVRNIIVDGQLLTSIQGIAVGGGNLYHCIAKNCTNSGIRQGYSTGTTSVACLIQGCTTVAALTGGGIFLNSAIIDCTGPSGASAPTLINSVVRGCVIGILCNSINLYANNSVYNCSSDGFQASNGNSGTLINNISYGNTGKGFNGSGRSGFSLINCAEGSSSNSVLDPAFFTVVNYFRLTANPWVNSSAAITTIEDVWAAFALNTVAGGGAVCRAAGYLPYLDIGSLQHQDSGGSSGGGTPILASSIIRGLGVL